MKQHKVCIIGGSGFIGGSIAGELARLGHNVTILTRRRERHRDLLVLPTAQVVETDPYDEVALASVLAGHDVAINLVGILNERGHRGRGFTRAHVELPGIVVAACRRAGVGRLLHMSALGADADKGTSHYLRSKGAGEALVMAADDLNVTVFRPSVVFGPGDRFLNRFAGLLHTIPLTFPLAGANARFAPIYVGDVASAFISTIDNRATFGRRYDLCGPREYTLLQLVEMTARELGLRRWVLPLPGPMAWLQAAVMEWLPGKPLSLDNYNSLRTPSVCAKPMAPELGVTPTALEVIAPTYLVRDTLGDAYSRMRNAR